MFFPDETPVVEFIFMVSTEKVDKPATKLRAGSLFSKICKKNAKQVSVREERFSQ